MNLRCLCVGLLLVAGMCGCGGAHPDTAEGIDDALIQPAYLDANQSGADRVTLAADVDWRARGQRFADDVAVAVQGKDAAGLSRMIDWEAVLDRVFQGSPVSKQVQQGAREGFLEQVVPGKGFAKEIVDMVAAGATYEPIHIGTARGENRVLFRLFGEQGLNYHEYILQANGESAVAQDVYIFLVGEDFSQTLRRSMLPMLAQADGGLFARLTGQQQKVIEQMDQMLAFQEMVQRGDYRGAIALHRTLPQELQQNVSVITTRLKAANQLGDQAEIAGAVDALIAAQAGNASCDLLLMDVYALKKEYDKALASIDRLDQAVGGDPLLDVMRLGVLLQANQPARALEPAERLVASYPDNQEHRFTLVHVLLQNAAFERLADELTTIESDLGIAIDNIQNVPDYGAFLASPAGQKWLANRAGAAAPMPAPVPQANEGFLTWSDRSGKFQTEAKLISTTDDAVVLEKRDGKQITVPMTRLSDASRRQAAGQ